MKPPTDYVRYDDEKLISLIAQLQEQALAQLYERYHRVVFSLAFAIVNDAATAEEITLDVFMRVWQKAGSYRADQAKVSTWLTHIARNHAIDVLRRRTVRVDHYAVSLDDVSSNDKSFQQDPQESTELSLRRERVQAALAQLPPDQKQAMMLAYFKGYTHREIAQILKQPLGTIKTRLRLAMQKLRDFLHDEEEAQDTSMEAPSAYNINKD
ncbi:MAG TPA: sigma-70 family RNA polymerase sigma factor [Anaerolineales bacterium]|nr:sigma-70 family RNA polymerase sigma factor [Anaerolineales bacterium]